MKETFYICENCGNLTTESEILDECSNGGTGLCDCRFGGYVWDEELDDLDYYYPKEYTEYTEINKKWYDLLNNQPNTVLRLQTFRQIPKERLK